MGTRIRQHGYKRLARDLDAVTLLIEHRADVAKRLHRELGTTIADELVSSLVPSRSGYRRQAAH